MYQALYRKYRPRTFSEVSGQPHITKTLQNQLLEGRISHAYLFTGSRGTGKTSCAKILAKAVNCLHPQNGDPCNECEVCKGIEAGAIMDVLEMDAASNNGVNDIRDIREKVEYTPSSAKYRVYIIDEVHMLSAGAFNALLKTLEEPPAHAIFILATTEVHKLPATILSRCQRFDFGRIPPEAIAARLAWICGQEDMTISNEAALLIARLADGGLRDAVSLLDVCASAAREITEETVISAAGVAGRDHLFELWGYIEQRDAAGALRCVDRLHKASCDMGRLCEELISHLRNLMLCKTLGDVTELIVCPASELERLQQQAAGMTLPAVLHGMDALENCLRAMKQGAARRPAMESALLKLASPELDVTPEALLRRIDALGGRLRAAGAPPTGVGAEEPPEKESKASLEKSEAASPAPAPNAALSEPAGMDFPLDLPDPPPPQDPPALVTSPAGEPEQEPAPVPLWPEILAVVKETSPMIYAFLNDSAAYEKNGVLFIDAPNQSFRKLINESKSHREAIKAAALQVTGKSYKLGPYRRPAAPQEKAPDPLRQAVDRMKAAGVDVEIS